MVGSQDARVPQGKLRAAVGWIILLEKQEYPSPVESRPSVARTADVRWPGRQCYCLEIALAVLRRHLESRRPEAMALGFAVGSALE